MALDLGQRVRDRPDPTRGRSERDPAFRPTLKPVCTPSRVRYRQNQAKRPVFAHPYLSDSVLSRIVSARQATFLHTIACPMGAFRLARTAESRLFAHHHPSDKALMLGFSQLFAHHRPYR
jgi:hypothetical protein